MINLKLLEIIQESLPNFDGENSSDLIKAKKILKAQQKVDAEISSNDIENFISFSKENGNKFNVFFQDENLSKIFRNEYFKINSSHNRVFPNITQVTPEFKTFGEEHIKKYIQINIQQNDWENLRIFYKNYFPVISPLVKEHLIDQLVQKNQLVRSIIPFPDNYNYLLIQYKHGINPHFYALQSDIDSSFFNEEILDINNDISDNQNIEPFFKSFLGRILVALGHFDAYTEELRRILKKNSRIGAEWASKESSFDPKIIEKRFQQRQQEMQKSGMYYLFFDRGKNKPLEWLIIAGYYFITIAIFKVLLSLNNYVFIITLIAEFIIFLIFNKKMNKRFERVFNNTKNPILGNLKRFGHKLIQLQVYTFIIGVFAMIFAGLIVSWVTQPILGILLTIVLPFIVTRELKKYK
jgi:hypothetical protein